MTSLIPNQIYLIASARKKEVTDGKSVISEVGIVSILPSHIKKGMHWQDVKNMVSREYDGHFTNANSNDIN